MMSYWMRITIGTLFGIVAGAALWFFVGTPWLVATIAALAAAIGFLGSYFIWSADRPDEGYEQVLFDRPNTLVAVALLVSFGLLGMGTTFLAPGVAAPSMAVDVSALYVKYQAAADAYAKDEADGETTFALMDELKLEATNLTAALSASPESAERAALLKATEALATAIEAMKQCAGGDTSTCVDARLAAADAQGILSRL